ncbi:hypothetical protein [Micromonospora siamensis]|uniref:hypothetical protein n=1 Tax=Micromonospora siamensis TaxID=299152 RepID=UPI0012FD8884|nr:hypothetical protein [Micromonospora siamensis]
MTELASHNAIASAEGFPQPQQHCAQGPALGVAARLPANSGQCGHGEPFSKQPLNRGTQTEDRAGKISAVRSGDAEMDGGFHHPLHFLAELGPSIFEQRPKVRRRRFEYVRWKLAREGLKLGHGQSLCSGARPFGRVTFLIVIPCEDLHLVRRHTSGRHDKPRENVKSTGAALNITWLDGNNLDRSSSIAQAGLQAVAVAVRPKALGFVEDQTTKSYGSPCIREVAQELVELLSASGPPAQLRVDQYHLGSAVDVPAPDTQVGESAELPTSGLVPPTVVSFYKDGERGLKEQLDSIRPGIPDEKRRPRVTLQQVGSGVPRWTE